MSDIREDQPEILYRSDDLPLLRLVSPISLEERPPEKLHGQRIPQEKLNTSYPIFILTPEGKTSTVRTHDDGSLTVTDGSYATRVNFVDELPEVRIKLGMATEYGEPLEVARLEITPDDAHVFYGDGVIQSLILFPGSVLKAENGQLFGGALIMERNTNPVTPAES
jgi:hypothetical protein